MLGKDMIQTTDSLPKHFITEITIRNCKNVHPLPRTDSKLYNVLRTYFEHCVGCMTQAQAGFLAINDNTVYIVAG